MPNIIMADAKGGESLFELIDKKTIALEEYTDTTTAEITDTGINVKNTNYTWFLVIVTCDSAITSNNEWGMSVFLAGRYTSGGTWNLFMPTGSGTQLFQKGSDTLLKSELVNPTTAGGNSIGLCLINNTATVKFSRKVNATICTKFRAGNYTVKVYGMKSFG